MDRGGVRECAAPIFVSSREIAMPSLRDFANITMRIIGDDNLSEYLPTLVDLDSNHVRVIEGIPDDVDHRDAVQKTISRDGLGERSLCFGVKSGPGCVTVGFCSPGKAPEFMEIVRTDEGLAARDIDRPEWWVVL